MVIFDKSKKGVVEITSFVLITTLVVVVSLTTYFVLNDVINSDVERMERDNMEIFFKKLNIEMNRVQAFDSTTISVPLTFHKGGLVFLNDTLTYISLIPYSGLDENCFSGICYTGSGGFETISITLSGGYSFSSDFKLGPGDYVLIMSNVVGSDEIDVKFK